MKRYKLEILWDTGDLTEHNITEKQLKLLEEHKELFILAKYSLAWAPEARPVSFQVWDENDEPLFPVGDMAEAMPV